MDWKSEVTAGDIGEMLSGFHDKQDAVCTVVSGTKDPVRFCNTQAAYPELRPGECQDIEEDESAYKVCICNTPLCNGDWWRHLDAAAADDDDDDDYPAW